MAKIIEMLLAYLTFIFAVIIFTPILIIGKLFKVGYCKTCGSSLRFTGYDEGYECPHCDNLERFNIEKNTFETSRQDR